MKTTEMKQRIRSAEASVKYLKQKIAISMQQLGVVVDDSLHSGLEGIMQGNTTNIQEKYAEGSFHRLFWDQQMKAMSTGPKQ